MRACLGLGSNVRLATLEYMQQCALDQALLPKDVNAIRLADPPPHPAPTPTPAAAPAPDPLREQLEVLRVQRRQIDGYLADFQRQGQRDEVAMLARSRTELDLEIARVEQLIRTASRKA
jgi:hypothetical protein